MAALLLLDCRGTDSLSNWKLRSEQSLHFSVTVRQYIPQDIANEINEMIRESFESVTGSEPALGQVSTNSLYYYEAKIEGSRFAIARRHSSRPSPDMFPLPSPNEFWDVAVGLSEEAFWRIIPLNNYVSVNTDLLETFNFSEEIMLSSDRNLFADIYFANTAKNLGFPIFPGKLTWHDNSTFEGAFSDQLIKGKVSHSNGRVISAFYTVENAILSDQSQVQHSVQYTYPDTETWIPSQFVLKKLVVEDSIPSEEKDHITFELNYFTISEEPFPDSDFDPLTYYIGDTNRLRYEFISGGITNYLAAGAEERRRRAAAWRKKMIRNRIVFGVLLVFFGIVIYFAIYGSPWKQWKRWRSGKGWWP